MICSIGWLILALDILIFCNSFWVKFLVGWLIGWSSSMFCLALAFLKLREKQHNRENENVTIQLFKRIQILS